METQNAQNQTMLQTETDNDFSRLDFLFSQIPDHVYDWLFSKQAAVNVTALAKRFSLDEIKTVQLARLTGLAILKDITLAEMTLELKKSLALDDSLARQLAIATAQAQFLPIRDHLVGVEDFIRQLGGALPAALPPLLKSTLPSSQGPAVPRGEQFSGGQRSETAPAGARDEQSEPYAAPPVVQKTLRQLAQESKESLNQNLTSRPIKIADFDQPVRPTIKNWLVDYVKIKGAGHHESLERADYLFNNQNTKDLPEKERALVAAILNAYDNDLPLTVRKSDQQILLETLAVSPVAPQKPAPSRPATTLPKEQLSKSSASYREPITPADLTGPLKQTPSTKSAPRLSGNIIDLKDLE